MTDPHRHAIDADTEISCHSISDSYVRNTMAFLLIQINDKLYMGIKGENYVFDMRTNRNDKEW